MDTFVVIATALNLRSAPRIVSGNVITTLPNGHEAELIDRTDSDWWKVRTELGARVLTGYVAARYLKSKQTAPPLETHAAIAPVHFPIDSRARRDSTRARFSPLSEALPTRAAGSAASERIAALYRIIDALDVERSARYQRTRRSTYCNIYAYDYCYFAGAYLPRVWWSAKALIALSKGEVVSIAYGKTVYEQNANALHDWLLEWGDDFGWTRAFDLSDLQDKVNEGGVGIICAKRRDVSRSGHITCVIPETPSQTAERMGAAVVAPLQSQAGAKNKRSFRSAWWVARAHEYSSTVYFHHD